MRRQWERRVRFGEVMLQEGGGGGACRGAPATVRERERFKLALRERTLTRIKRCVQRLGRAHLVGDLEVENFGLGLVDHSAKDLAVVEGLAPAAFDADAVALAELLGPVEQLGLIATKLVDLVPQDERPRQPEDELLVAPLDVLRPDVHELDRLGLELREEGVVVLELREARRRLLVVAAARRVREHLEQLDRQHARHDVGAEIVDPEVDLGEPRVPPARERAKLLLVELGAQGCPQVVARALLA